MNFSSLNYHHPFSIPYTIVIATLFASILLYFLHLFWSTTKSKTWVPEAAGGWPIIGHLLVLARSNNLPHITFGSMADKYGPAFTIRIGLHRSLVVSSSEVLKDIFITNDITFSSRPKVIAMKYMGYNYANFGFAPYGPYWQKVHKIVNHELLSKSRLESLQHVWVSEIQTSIKQLYKLWVKGTKEEEVKPVLIELKKWVSDLMLNISVRIIVGKRFEFGSNTSGCDEAVKFQKALRELFRLMGMFVLSDAMPFLGWLDLGGYEKEMKKTARELDFLLEGWLEEHKRKRYGEIKHEKDDEITDFMGVLISILGDGKLHGFDVDVIIKSTCLTLLLGGSDTTMVSLVWTIASLVNHPHVLKKMKDELDVHIGRDRRVDESDIKNLVYLQAVVKETMRLYPPGPLAGPRESTKDCIVAGYHIPVGTRLIVNTWKIQRDPMVWSDPLEYKPERFLEDQHGNMDVAGQNFEFVPFGSGRRSCPGSSFALQVVHLTLAYLIHGFELKTSCGAPTDMTESPGLTNVKATPLEVLLIPRLASKLYL
uniref:Putative cytochrome P450 n=1 Tax=Eschscholzia californica subsp. californica TaxID=222997 RepID=A0A2Z6BXS0_ESCCA|nr:putative cytochrome P450 [Eschscholzia californica subsp. californica]